MMNYYGAEPSLPSRILNEVEPFAGNWSHATQSTEAVGAIARRNDRRTGIKTHRPAYPVRSTGGSSAE